MGSAVDDWFVSEVLVHEQALMRFLHRNWRDHDEVPDLRQEVYVRVYEAATRRVPDSPKSFLFATARNLLVDRVRHQRIVPITAVGDIEQLHVMQDELEPGRWLGGREALARLARAARWSGCDASRTFRKRKSRAGSASAKRPSKNTSPRDHACWRIISTEGRIRTPRPARRGASALG